MSPAVWCTNNRTLLSVTPTALVIGFIETAVSVRENATSRDVCFRVISGSRAKALQVAVRPENITATGLLLSM